MLVLVQASVLTVGLNGKNEVLKELPIRLIKAESGSQAARCLKQENVDSVISNWDLPDMNSGKFMRKLRSVKPQIPTIVFVRGGEPAEEIEARSLGVSAVLTDESDDDLFRETVANVLGIRDLVSIKQITATEKEEPSKEHSESFEQVKQG